MKHIRPNTALDELTIWNKALAANRTVDETQYFLGGYGKSFHAKIFILVVNINYPYKIFQIDKVVKIVFCSSRF